jgi:hypothetical protein
MAVYTAIDNPALFHEAKKYTGNNNTNNITGMSFQPDWVWLKVRSAGSGQNHTLYDSVRGATKFLESDTTNAEATGSNYLTAFNSDGFTLGNDQSHVNANSDTYMSWSWKSGTSFTNDASSTGVGTIDSAGSTNQTAGFSIVSWTGTGSAGTVAHNLGSVPEWYIIKNRSDANNWAVYHQKSNSNPEQYALYLDGTSAATDDSGLANDTAPTNTVFSLTNGNYGNQNTYNYIGYFFAEKQGYSKFGKYVGLNSSNGNFVYLGFRPKTIFFKRIDSTGDWRIYDDQRDGFNIKNDYLEINTSDVESDTDSGSQWDILSNGFKFSGATDAEFAGGGTYIYMAWAHSPFVNSKGVPNNPRG